MCTAPRPKHQAVLAALAADVAVKPKAYFDVNE